MKDNFKIKGLEMFSNSDNLIFLNEELEVEINNANIRISNNDVKVLIYHSSIKEFRRSNDNIEIETKDGSLYIFK